MISVITLVSRKGSDQIIGNWKAADKDESKRSLVIKEKTMKLGGQEIGYT